MNILELLNESSRTDKKNSFGTQFFEHPNGKGYLGVPIAAYADVIFRDILCDNQGLPMVPYMKRIAESDTHVWYETEVLEESYIKYFPSIHHRFIGNCDMERISSPAKETLLILSAQIPEDIADETEYDLHPANVRQNADGDLFFCDPFVYRGYTDDDMLDIVDDSTSSYSYSSSVESYCSSRYSEVVLSEKDNVEIGLISCIDRDMVRIVEAYIIDDNLAIHNRLNSDYFDTDVWVITERTTGLGISAGTKEEMFHMAYYLQAKMVGHDYVTDDNKPTEYLKEAHTTYQMPV